MKNISFLKIKTTQYNFIFSIKDRKKEWYGDNQLYDNEMKECKVRTYPKFNRVIIFSNK